MFFSVALFCVSYAKHACVLPVYGTWATLKVRYGTIDIAVYDRNDVVSDSIRVNHSWEPEVSRFLTQGNDTFVDIGAHIGVHSFFVAAEGISVVSVEPLLSNLELFRASLCRNPELATRITLLPTAFGYSRAWCKMFSSDDNIGNGILSCDYGTSVLLQVQGLFERQSVYVSRFSDVMNHFSVSALKLDTEGREEDVIGTMGFFPKYVVVDTMEPRILNSIRIKAMAESCYMHTTAWQSFLICTRLNV